MRYLSVCSGIEAATVAWEPLEWTPAGFSEIEKFPRAVLEQRFGATPVDFDHRHRAGSNTLPLFGDFTQIEEHHVGPIDLLVGGTPCQPFSVAGKRLGLDDPRGNLTLEYLALARRLRPRWLAWENVPGILSDDEGRTMGTFLGIMGELGYRWAYRVLDAQFVRVDGFGRAVPQRRRRVFVIGHLGDDARAAAVLLDRESLLGDPAPRREAGQGVAGPLDARSTSGGFPGTDGACSGHDVPAALDPGLIAIADSTGDSGAVVSKWSKGSGGPAGDECQNLVAQTLRAEGFDASEDGTGRGTPIIPVDLTNCSLGDAVAGTVEHAQHKGNRGQFVAFSCKNSGGDGSVSAQLTTGGGKPGQGQPCIAEEWAVRRLTPRECERLQGFPDDWTRIEWRGKPAADGPRYKAIGNSMAVNVMRWIGMRIAWADEVAVDNDQAAFAMDAGA